ncbi:MAG: hypothetical protein RIE32_11580 [Phycisphaerales bacterium]
MAEVRPLVSWKERNQVPLDHGHRGIVRGQAKPLAQPLDVGVDDEPFIDAKGVAEHDAGRFPCDASQGEQFIHRLWYLATKVLDHAGHRRVDRLGLVAV